MYKTSHQKNSPWKMYLVKLFLVGVGCVIGASVGMYYAAKTLPLPTENVIYVSGQQ